MTKITSATLEDGEVLVSIVLTTFNSERVLEKTLRGIIEQDFPLNRVELIIVDGGSKDNTLKIIREFITHYARKFYDINVIVHDKNYGVSKARNDGLKESRGKYLLILDHDVYMEGNVLHKLYEFLSNSPSRIIGAMPLLVPVSNNLLNRWRVRVLEGRITEYYAVADCILLRRDVVELIGYYDETLGPPFTIFEEREYGARIESKGFKIYMLGWIKAYHYCNVEDEDREQKSNRKTFSRILSALHTLINEKYLYGLRKWFKSMSLSQKIRWLTYLILALSFTPIATISIITKTPHPLITWLIPAAILYMDTLKQYWNYKVFHISLTYAFIAYMWRLIRALGLVLSIKVNV